MLEILGIPNASARTVMSSFTFLLRKIVPYSITILGGGG